jgi:hypothetical protein
MKGYQLPEDLAGSGGIIEQLRRKLLPAVLGQSEMATSRLVPLLEFNQLQMVLKRFNEV